MCLLRAEINYLQIKKINLKMFTLKNVAFSLGLVTLFGMIECRPEAPPPKPKVRLNLTKKKFKRKKISK